jgi:enoyl-[acyl-carrier protein] reductase/trans-2-enoyl-CoA reductase (NAD+)
VTDVTIEPANEKEIAETVMVMGGEDWRWWIEALDKEGVLSPTAGTLAYSYIGPELTYSVYRHGTIGEAKKHLEATAKQLNSILSPRGGYAYVSVNKALVTQASSAIPVVPLYIALLYKVMKNMGLHEGCIEQIYRLYADQLSRPNGPELDENGLIRIDDWEMKPEVQAAVAQIWDKVQTENLKELTDFEGYQTEFLKLFGFGLKGVDYTADSDPTKISGEPAAI